MPEYRRWRLPDGTFFFTVVVEDRSPIFRQSTARLCLRNAFKEANASLPFDTKAIVLLPEHVHAIWSLPDGDSDYSKRWGMLKKSFTQAWLRQGGRERPVSPSRRRDRRRGVLQRRFWEHMIRDDLDYQRHCDYIHYNPVKHGLVGCPHAWPYSSFHRFVKEGFYSLDWLCTCAARRPKPPCFADLDETAME